MISTGVLTATCYVDILEASLLPFLDSAYPDSHRYMRDNDLVHTGQYAQWWYEDRELVEDTSLSLMMVVPRMVSLLLMRGNLEQITSAARSQMALAVQIQKSYCLLKKTSQ